MPMMAMTHKSSTSVNPLPRRMALALLEEEECRSRRLHCLSRLCSHPLVYTPFPEPHQTNLNSSAGSRVVRGSPDPAHTGPKVSCRIYDRIRGDLRSTMWHGQEIMPQQSQLGSAY